MGAEAVLALMDATPDTEPCVISLDGNTAVRVPLMACVEKTQAVAKAMADKDWDKAIALRGRSFQSNLQTYRYSGTQHSHIYFMQNSVWPWHENGLIKTIPIIPHTTWSEFQVMFPSP